MGHLLGWPEDLLKLEYKGLIVRYEGNAFITDEWGQLNYSDVLLSGTELGQILIHAQRARLLVALHEEGR